MVNAGGAFPKFRDGIAALWLAIANAMYEGLAIHVALVL